ncbi:MAG: hypothetical protein KDC98_08075 [Planctomycetes bacterium]|nr:hypothetical protein [Planctomycetota bacterium]
MNLIKNSLILAASVALLPGLTRGQSTTAFLPIGYSGAYGCQSSSAPVITGGVVAHGAIDFIYDAGTAMLTVRVTNQSPIVAGETNPVITRIAFNFPAGAVTGASLIGQSAQGGAQPAFALQFSPTQSIRQACFGDFHALLSVSGVNGGIGNADATVFSPPIVVLGRTRFELQLAGPGTASMTAADIANAFSDDGPQHDVAVMFKFQAGGAAGQESGFVSSGPPCCPNQAAVNVIGSGCAPAGQTVPVLTSIGAPNVPGPVGVDVSSPSTPNSVGLLIFSQSTTFDATLNVTLPHDLTPYGFAGCNLYTATVWPVAVATDASGNGSYSTNIPALAKWCERELTFQAFFLNNGLYSTAGLTQILGS